jgi:hypothetical protein
LCTGKELLCSNDVCPNSGDVFVPTLVMHLKGGWSLVEGRAQRGNSSLSTRDWQITNDNTQRSTKKKPVPRTFICRRQSSCDFSNHKQTPISYKLMVRKVAWRFLYRGPFERKPLELAPSRDRVEDGRALQLAYDTLIPTDYGPVFVPTRAALA